MFTSKDGEGKPNGAEKVFGDGGNIDESLKMIKNLYGIVKNEPIKFGSNLNNPVNGANHLVGSQKKADNINSTMIKVSKDTVIRRTVWEEIFSNETMKGSGVMIETTTDSVDYYKNNPLYLFDTTGLGE